MTQLDIIYPDGREESQRLSRRRPIVVGRNPICDIHVDEDGVAPIHCRIQYRDKRLEVTAASAEPVDVNGTLVKEKTLVADDVVRVGGVDLVVHSSQRESRRKRDEDARERRAPTVAATGPEGVGEDANSSFQAADELSEREWAALSEGIEQTPAARVAPAAPPIEPREDACEPVADSKFQAEPVLLDEQGDLDSGTGPSVKKAEAPSSAKSTAPQWAKLRQRRRPGEQDILTSPLVLGLGTFALCLLLAAGAIWLLIGRESANRLYTAALADRQSGRYTQAIAKFEQFVINYPTDSRVLEARHLAGLTRIERQASGARPDYEKALTAFDRFVRANRDGPRFASLSEELASLAAEITSGASAAAIRTGRRDFLPSAKAGLKLFVRYANDSQTVQETRRQLETGLQHAQAAVRKEEYFESIAATIKTALDEGDFTTAYQARWDLSIRYPDFRKHERLAELLAQVLAAERKAIARLDEPQAASRPVDDGADLPALTLINHTQARFGEQSDGRMVIAVVGDQLVGLDVVTGQPLWSTTIGIETPFFPIEVDGSVPALLAFDAARGDLLLVARKTGAALWRTHIGHLAAGPPRVAQGQIDLATRDGYLVRLTLQDGAPIAVLRFPQSLAGSPLIMADRQDLVVFGEQASAYVLDYRTLEPRGVSFIGHARGALAVAPQHLGRLVLTFENQGLDSATIRVLSFDPESTELRTIATAQVAGTIETPPESFGNVLYVASSMERITAYSLSDDPGAAALTRLAGVQITEPRDVPTFLAPGSDGMLWAAGSALRSLHLVAEDLTILPQSLAPGRHTQPVQQSGEGLFVARRLPSSRAIYVSQADRGSMTGSWRCVLGANVIASARAEKKLTLVTGAGQVAIVTPETLKQPVFLDTSLLPGWREKADAPLAGTSLGDGTGLVWQAGESAHLWRIRSRTAVGKPREISAVPQADPVLLDGGIVLPVPGRLIFLAEAGKSTVEPYLLLITDDGKQPPAWLSVVALDEETLAALTDDGELRIIRRRDEPAPYLAEIATTDLTQSTERPLAAAGGNLFVAQGKRIEKRDPTGLRPLAEYALSSRVTAGPWIVDETVIVQAGEQVVFLGAKSLTLRFTCSFSPPLAGAPLRLDGTEADSGWLLAGREGTIRILTKQGEPRRRMSLARRLGGLLEFAGGPLVVAIGGAIIPLPLNEALRETVSAAGRQEEKP